MDAAPQGGGFILVEAPQFEGRWPTATTRMHMRGGRGKAVRVRGTHSATRNDREVVIADRFAGDREPGHPIIDRSERCVVARRPSSEGAIDPELDQSLHPASRILGQIEGAVEGDLHAMPTRDRDRLGDRFDIGASGVVDESQDDRIGARRGERCREGFEPGKILRTRRKVRRRDRPSILRRRKLLKDDRDVGAMTIRSGRRDDLGEERRRRGEPFGFQITADFESIRMSRRKAGGIRIVDGNLEGWGTFHAGMVRSSFIFDKGVADVDPRLPGIRHSIGFDMLPPWRR